MGLREKLHQYISDNIGLFDCSGDCPDEVALNTDLRTPEYCHKCFTKQIVNLVKEAGYVKLAHDQTLPVSNKGYYQETAAGRDFITIERSVDPIDMLNAGWRKMEVNKDDYD